MYHKITFVCLILLIFCSCQRNEGILNRRQGKLKATYELISIHDKSFALDSNTAAKPKYLQLLKNKNSWELSFLNVFTNSLYFYNYKTGNFLNRLTFNKKGSNGVGSVLAYLIKNQDSIYLYSQPRQQILLVNNQGIIKDSISLIGNMNPKEMRWTLQYPQFYPFTAAPILGTANELLFPGQYIWAIPDSLIKKFKFTAKINYDIKTVKYLHSYPKTVFGSNFNWDDPIFTATYADLDRSHEKLIYSFPISHDLYIGDLITGTMKPIYGGSNYAKTIQSVSINSKDDLTYRAELGKYIIATDLYAGIKFDPYRKIYYRFLRKAVSPDSVTNDWKKKPLSVIMMDEAFNYLGETTIGTLRDINWENSFVSEEGLNIEYTPASNDETKLIFKVFVPKKLTK